MNPKTQFQRSKEYFVSFATLLLIVLSSQLLFNSCQKEDDLTGLKATNQLKSTEDGYVTFFEKELFIRATGKPIIVNRQIGNATIHDYEDCFKLYVQSGVDGGGYVSSAIVKVDGITILSTSNFNNSNQSFQFDLCNLTEASMLEVQINGTPGSTLNIWIEGKLANSGTFIDERDGHEYKWVRICDNIWMAENLAYLPSVSPSSEISNAEPSYNVYGYEGTVISEAKATENYKSQGVLYNWAAAMQGESSSDSNPSGVHGISPAGWHLPSYSEWNSMLQCVGNGGNPYYNLIVGGTTGFEANFSGIRGGDGQFYSLGLASYIWSSTSQSDDWAYKCTIDNTVNLAYGDAAYKIAGFSIRCVKDQ